MVASTILLLTLPGRDLREKNDTLLVDMVV